MDHQWRLQNEILTLTHRWPVILAFILAGSLLVWALSLLLPKPYRATYELYVGLDPQRGKRDLQVARTAGKDFRFLDDYKNWQMSQLNYLATQPDILEETLRRLQEQDPHWRAVPLETLQRDVDVFFRTTGRWRLVAEGSDPGLTTQLVTMWGQVLVERVNQAIDQAQALLLLEAELRAIAETRLSLELHQNDLLQTRADLSSIQATLSGSEQLDDLERWRLESMAARVARLDPAWRTLLAQEPPSDAPAQDYQVWIDRILLTIDQDLQMIPGQLEELAETGQMATQRFEKTAPAALGLSANLVVEPPPGEPAAAQPIRSDATAALIGGGIGLLGWGLSTTISLARRMTP